MGAPISTSRFVLLGGGEIRDLAAVRARICPEDFILCVDSGYGHCAALGVVPHLLVGDMDSLRTQPPAALPRIVLPPEKNHTDTTHAIEEALRRGCKTMLLAGMLGGRLDHTLANLQSLAGLARRGVDALLTDGHTDAFCIHCGSATFSPRANCYFSVLSMSRQSTGVYIRNARYLLHDHTLYFDHPRGISNEFLAGDATVSVQSGTLLVLVVPKDGCQTIPV